MRTLSIPRALAGALAAAAVGVAGLAPAASAAETRHVIDVGHVDAIDVHAADGALELLIHDDNTSPATLRDPADVLFHIKPAAAYVVPEGLPPAYGFIGEAGDTVWLLPQVQSENPDVAWLGWASQRLTPGTVTGTMDLQLVAAEGPGEVFVFQSDPFGNPMDVWRTDGALPDSFPLPLAAHVHASWVFTQPGDYTLTFQVDGTSATTGETISTGPVPYSFRVGELAPDPVGTSLSIAGLAEHYDVGETVSLSAVQDPVTDLDHYHWFVRAAGASEYVVVPGALSDSLSFPASQDLDGASYVAKLYDHDHNVVAESPPVTLTVHDHGEEPVETVLSIAGLAEHYDVGETVSLSAVQDPATGLDHYHWFVQPAGGSEFVIVPNEATGSYTFTAEATMDGAQYVVKLYGDEHAVVAESAPVTLLVHDDGEPAPALSQTITATLDEDDGALVVSVDPADREVVMGPFGLSSQADRWVSDGELRPVLVTDTRAGLAGWNVSGQVGAFSSDAAAVGAEHLGWSPSVASQSDGQGVVPGAPVAPSDVAGEGLSSSRTLASAPAGAGLGTATLGAGLTLELPTATPPGAYVATLTITAI